MYKAVAETLVELSADKNISNYTTVIFKQMNFINTKPFRNSKISLRFKFSNVVIKDVSYSLFVNANFLRNTGKCFSRLVS